MIGLPDEAFNKMQCEPITERLDLRLLSPLRRILNARSRRNLICPPSRGSIYGRSSQQDFVFPRIRDSVINCHAVDDAARSRHRHLERHIDHQAAGALGWVEVGQEANARVASQMLAGDGMADDVTQYSAEYDVG